MKNIKKVILYTYRILLFLAIIGVITWLLARIFFFLFKQIASIYLPYSAWLVFILLCAAGVWAMVSEAKSQRDTRRKQAEWEKMEHPDFTTELTKIVETCLATYPYEVKKGEDAFTLFMPNHSRSIHFDIDPSAIRTQIFVGGWDENFYDIVSPDDLKDLEEALSSDLDDWLNDRIVQVCFMTGEEKFPYSFACSAVEMEEVISKRLKDFFDEPFLIRILRPIFLFPPPKPILEVQITSANGIHDRIIPIQPCK